MSKRRRKTKTHLRGAAKEAGAAASNAPKSFVIRSGKVSTSVGTLVSEVRRVMEPNTATRLRERKSNKLRDFLIMCGPLGVSHMLLFSQKSAKDARIANSEAIGNINMRIAKTPRGPTVTFRITKFALCKDVAKAQRRARATGGEYNTAPLLVLNNFGSAERHVKLLVSVFQGLFPPIPVQTMHLSQARRIVLLHYNDETQTIEWRHYLISVRPVGVSRKVRRVVEGSRTASAAASLSSKKIPNLSSAKDISDYLLGSQDTSGAAMEGGFETDASSASEADSDVEEGQKPSNHVQLPDAYIGRGNVRDSQRAVRLVELGPRMEMRCVKIEEGIPGAGKDAKGSSGGGNEVLWHDYVKKSSSEHNLQRKTILEREKMRQQRRRQQEENVAKKKEEKLASKTSRRGKPDSTAVEEEEAVADKELSSADEGDDDEFAYEDMHGGVKAGDTAALFEEDDEEVRDDDSIADEEDDEEEDEDEEEDSDLSPIEIDDDEYSDEDDDQLAAPPPPPKSAKTKKSPGMKQR